MSDNKLNVMEKIEDAVVDTYKKVETTVVEGYKEVEGSFVGAAENIAEQAGEKLAKTFGAESVGAKTAKEVYQKIEDAVVGTYKKIEDGVVGTYQKVEDKFVETFLEKNDSDDEAQH